MEKTGGNERVAKVAGGDAVSPKSDESSLGAVGEGAKRQKGDVELETTQTRLGGQQMKNKKNKKSSNNNSSNNNAKTGKVSEGTKRVVGG